MIRRKITEAAKAGAPLSYRLGNPQHVVARVLNRSVTVLAVTVVQTVLILAVVPAAIYGLVMLIVLWPRVARVRYRAGQEWDYPAVFWVADPAGVSTTSAPVAGDSTAENLQPSTARGGARGKW